MDAQTFLDNLDTIADAPGGVDQLRGLIRDLAVRGQLVARQLSDGNGGVLAEQISTTRRELAQVAGVRLPKHLTSIGPDEVPFDTPSSWAWCRFGEIHQKLGAGSTPRGGQKVYVSEGVKFLRSQNVHNDGLRLDGVAHIPADVHKTMSATVVRPGDVLLNITGASIARAAVVPDDFDEANVSQHVAIVRPVLRETNQWVHLFLVSPHGYRAIMGAQVGISREGLSTTSLRDFLVPLPPLAEQERIVAKVDVLMQLCEDLEARQQARHRETTRLRASSLDALTSAGTDADLRTAWSRVHANWEALTDHHDSIDTLRELVLDLAVSGRLSDAERDLATGLPSTWLISPLGKFARLRRGFDLPKQSRAEGGVPIYGANGQVGTHSEAAVAGPGVVTGRSGTIGRVHHVEGEFWPLNTALYVEDFFGNDPEYAAIVLRSIRLERFSSYSAVPTLNRNVAHRELVGVPPLREQRQIVSKVKELTRLCDGLENALRSRSAAGAALAAGTTGMFAAR